MKEGIIGFKNFKFWYSFNYHLFWLLQNSNFNFLSRSSLNFSIMFQKILFNKDLYILYSYFLWSSYLIFTQFKFLYFNQIFKLFVLLCFHFLLVYVIFI